MADQLPALGSHFAEQGVGPSMYCAHWFITAFAYALPFDHLLRVWDVFLAQGIKVRLRCTGSKPLLTHVPLLRPIAAPVDIQLHGRETSEMCSRLQDAAHLAWHPVCFE